MSTFSMLDIAFGPLVRPFSSSHKDSGGSHGTWDYLVDRRWLACGLGSGEDYERRRIRSDCRHSSRNRRWHRWRVARRPARFREWWLATEHSGRNPGSSPPDLGYQAHQEGSLKSWALRPIAIRKRIVDPEFSCRMHRSLAKDDPRERRAQNLCLPYGLGATNVSQPLLHSAHSPTHTCCRLSQPASGHAQIVRHIQ